MALTLVVVGLMPALRVRSRTSRIWSSIISVTTVPAAGNLALGLAFWERTEIVGSLEQLIINIIGMVIAGAAVLLAMRAWWPWVTDRSDRVFGRQSDIRS